jgi:dienelactone hydrolase
VVLLGWSHGAWSVMELYALETGDRPPNLAAAPAADPRAAAGVVLFYPYCGVAAAARRGWSDAPPTLLLLAEQDSITPARECRTWAEAHPSVTAHVYPGVDHGFDQAVAEPEWPSTYEPAAADDARSRVFAFVRQRTGLAP